LNISKIHSEPLVSILIPTYNHAQFLKDAINSVLEQTYKNVEIIVINNYSEDNTIEVVNIFQNKRIHLINFKNNGVIAASRNIGLKNANGDFIAFLDSDDIWKPSKLEKQLKIFYDRPEVLLIGTNLETFPKGRKNALKLGSDYQVSYKNLLKNNCFINSSVLIRKQVVSEIGFLDEDERLRTVEDYDYWLKILKFKDNSGYVLKEDLIKYRMHSSNLSGSGFNFDFYKSFEKQKIILEKHLEKNPDYVCNLIKQRKLKCIKGDIKFGFYNKKTTLLNLFKNDQIKFHDKLEIFLKGIVVFLLRKIKYKNY
jgi:glycosyltransferase involved in cell wall biosynthesis